MQIANIDMIIVILKRDNKISVDLTKIPADPYIYKKQNMRLILFFAILVLFTYSCKPEKKKLAVKTVNWEKRAIEIKNDSAMQAGRTYLPVYSEIYDQSAETTHLLTSTVSIRNTSLADSLFIITADYYNTKGELIRSYIKSPIFLAPMETIEIVIPRLDTSGGSGANFNFDWKIKDAKNAPLFETVMIWTTGTQGISFVTRGVNYTNSIN